MREPTLTSADSLGLLIGKMCGCPIDSQADLRSVLGLADGGKKAGCANFCFAPGGRLVCFAEDRIFLVEGLCVEGAIIAPDTA